MSTCIKNIELWNLNKQLSDSYTYKHIYRHPIYIYILLQHMIFTSKYNDSKYNNSCFNVWEKIFQQILFELKDTYI